MVSGNPVDPGGGEGEDRAVQVQGGHDVQPGGEAPAQGVRCPCVGPQQ